MNPEIRTCLRTVGSTVPSIYEARKDNYSSSSIHVSPCASFLEHAEEKENFKWIWQSDFWDAPHNFKKACGENTWWELLNVTFKGASVFSEPQFANSAFMISCRKELKAARGKLLFLLCLERAGLMCLYRWNRIIESFTNPTSHGWEICTCSASIQSRTAKTQKFCKRNKDDAFGSWILTPREKNVFVKTWVPHAWS